MSTRPGGAADRAIGHREDVAVQSGTPPTPASAPGLYVHVPFCARVCPYCDFAVQTGGPKKRRTFVQSLLREIDLWSERMPPRADHRESAAVARRESDAVGSREAAFRPRDSAPGGAAQLAVLPVWTCEEAFDTVYLGGGTPSALAPEALEDILVALRRRLPVAADVEVTLEANPEDVGADSLSAWRDLGISRLSIGVQSFDAAALSTLGRGHAPARAVAAVAAAVAAGFDAISLDLIFAVPGQARGRWRETLKQAVALQPHHISCYELTLHDGTGLFRARRDGRLVEVADEGKADQFFVTHRYLAEAGYAGYEVSNFARRPAFRSRHNAKYWNHSPYLGLGPSAHSFDGGRRRWWSERRLIDWTTALDDASQRGYEGEELAPSQLALEALALGLRTVDGVDLESIERRHGIALADRNAAVIEKLLDDGLLTAGSGSRLLPTLRGLAVADTLARAFDVSDVRHGPESPGGSIGRGGSRSPGARRPSGEPGR